MSRRKKKAIHDVAWVSHSLTMRRSEAWRALPDNARRLLDRLELEHMEHGGAENGFLKCTYTAFAAAGIRRPSIALAIRQCEALGFVRVTKRGGRSISDNRWPSEYFVTYLNGRGRSLERSDDWKRISTKEDANRALLRAAGTKNYSTQPVDEDGLRQHPALAIRI